MLWSKKDVMPTNNNFPKHTMPSTPIQPLTSPVLNGMNSPMVGGIMPKGNGIDSQVSGATTY